ncbi:MAG: hypothetical protein IKS83_09865, partial [Victivallales bacterium]|nr:hypothetical protein [Victivallales bacterium]
NIGAYTLRETSRTEQHIRDIAECGIDFMVCVPNDRAMLDLFQKYGIGAVVNGVLPGWWGGDGHHAGKLQELNPIEKYLAAAKEFQDHPAIWGIDIGDEPSALDFPYYGQVFACVAQNFPNQFPYLNLYPNYASVSENNATQTVNQLGTPTYQEHIDRYCENVPADYICYDYYLYSAGVQRHYENLRIVANACRATGRSLWIVLQVNSKNKEKWITENQLRFQAFSALAFGAENIIWACYSRAWWHNQVLTDDGEKTQQYDKLKKANTEIHALADEYMRYRNVGTHFLGFIQNSTDLVKLTQTPILESLSTEAFNDLQSKDGYGIIVGQMVPRNAADDSSALFVCAADDPLDEHPTCFPVTFRCNDGFTVTAFGAPLVQNPDGSYTLTMASCGGALLVAKRP